MAGALSLRAGGVIFHRSDGVGIALHPMWLRERSQNLEDYDSGCRQRLYDPWRLPTDLRVLSVGPADGVDVDVRFSDGHAARFDLAAVERELDPSRDPDALPPRIPWTAEGLTLPTATAAELDTGPGLVRFLDGFLGLGAGLIRGTGTEPGTILTVARRFGPVRETNFGVLFEVRVEENPVDLAYTPLALFAHTDNPYRKPIPGIQFLSCVRNDARGGDSTLVDGLAVANAMRDADPDGFQALTTTDIRYRYDGDGSVLEDVGRMIEIDEEGAVCRVRFNPRVEYVVPTTAGRLDAFYRARAAFGALLGDPRFEVRFRLEPGDTVMFDNHRLLHGRTAFHANGARHLQGCYIEHDGPESLYRVTRASLDSSVSNHTDMRSATEAGR
ncbi:MAG: TauD/TfdA family dioxygenase [Alphaproteobacteria bacterium]|nr:TauD/TfdA family dioxygenase [Alphaproteobacteria bacterium]